MDKLITNLDTNLGPVLREQLDSNFQRIQNGVDGQADSLNKQIETMLGDVPLQDKNEVTQARIDNSGKSHLTLKGRLDDIQSTAENALTEERLTGIEVQAARTNTSGKTYPSLGDRINDEEASLINNMNAKIAQISSVPETFANLSALQSTYPNGKTGLFVTADTGHKFIWANGAWNDAGIYQAVGLADNSIGNTQINNRSKRAYIVNKKPAILSIKERTLTIPTVYNIQIGGEVFPAKGQNYTYVINLDEGTSAFILYYNTDTADILATPYGAVPDLGVEIGWINILGTDPNQYFNTINYDLNIRFLLTDIENKAIFPADRIPTITARSKGNKVDIDTTTKSLKFPTDNMSIYYSGNEIIMDFTGTVTDDTDTSVSFIFFDQDNHIVKILPHLNFTIPPRYILMGVVDWVNIYDSVFYFPAAVDGLRVNTNLPVSKKIRFASDKPFVLDYTNKKLIINSGWSFAFVNDVQRSIDNTVVDLSVNDGAAAFLFYNPLTGEIIADQWYSHANYIYIGYVNWNPFSTDLPFNYIAFGDEVFGDKFGYNKATFFGDSITWSYNTRKWTSLVGTKVANESTFDGVSGSTYSVVTDRNDSAVERASNITEQDLITVWFGINDYHRAIPLGNFGDGDTSKVYGAVEATLSKLIANNPSAKIVVMTPMKTHGYTYGTDSFTPNSLGLVQLDYVNAIKKVAEYHSLPVLDMYTSSGMSPFDPAQASLYFRDGLHPSQAGEYRVANKVLNFIESN